MTTLARTLLLLALLSAPLSLQAASGRVTVFAGGNDRDLEALCVAALSHDRGIEIVERRHLDKLLGEKAVDAAFAKTATGAGVGRLVGVDFIVGLRRDGHAVDLEIIDCSSGKILSQGNTTPDKLGQYAASLLDDAAKKGCVPAIQPRSPSRIFRTERM